MSTGHTLECDFSKLQFSHLPFLSPLPPANLFWACHKSEIMAPRLLIMPSMRPPRCLCTSSWAPLLNTFLCRIRGTWHIPRLSRRVPKHNSWAEHFSFLANENRGNWTQTERGGTLEFHGLTCGSEQFPEVPNILEMRGWFLDSLNFILYAVNTE